MKVLVSLLTAISILTSFVPRTLPYPDYVHSSLWDKLAEGQSRVDFDTFCSTAYTHYDGSGSVQVFSTSYYVAVGWSDYVYTETDAQGNGGTNKTAYTQFDYYDTIFEPVQLVSEHVVYSNGQTWTAHTSDGH